MGKGLLLAAVMGGLGFGVGLGFGHMVGDTPDAAMMRTSAAALQTPPPPEARSHAWRRSGSDLVRPLLGCQPPSESGLEALRGPVAGVIERAREQGIVTRVGVYVYDLQNGLHLGIDADGDYAPASIGKVPLLMGLLRLEEGQRGTLETPIFYPDWMHDNERQGIRPEGAVGPGRKWTLGELAQAMIVESDNNATTLVRQALDPALVDRVYLDLGWQTRPASVGNLILAATSPRVIAGTFRILYNATYLGEGTSDMALRLLSRVRMRDGLVAGVPPDVTVAHKFGEWLVDSPDSSKLGQFHDCGIIYRPGRPYVLCVMTEGETAYQRPLIEVVAEISRVLWSGFDALPTGG